MVKRKARKVKKRKVARKPTRRRVVRRKKARKSLGASSAKAAVRSNIKTHWSVYRNLQKRAEQAWMKLRRDVKRNAAPHILMEDRNQLMLLLGECHYMAKECSRMVNRQD